GGASGGTLFGATIPFPASRQARETTGDPRRSIAERYASKTDYLERVQQAAEGLVQTNDLLAEDVEDILK
ncbi:MAG: alpha/beta hydrolase domain-containing protein, partial [Candidatus Tectomicrobia bacterium]|nr:alpha/beta hydrolase domain-containing protein [Candidatus Tectomicrobia bacterium]